MASDRIITTGFSGIWRNKESWLHLVPGKNPVITADGIANAASKNRVKSEILLFETRLKIMIYEAHPEKYESLDEIKI